eukprot:351083-Chlamydomonas_euryale.AAC.9
MWNTTAALRLSHACWYYVSTLRFSRVHPVHRLGLMQVLQCTEHKLCVGGKGGRRAVCELTEAMQLLWWLVYHAVASLPCWFDTSEWYGSAGTHRRASTCNLPLSHSQPDSVASSCAVLQRRKRLFRSAMQRARVWTLHTSRMRGWLLLV